MKWEFQKLQMKSVTTDCNGKGLPLEAATGRWNGPGMQGRLDRESDWKLEWESVNGRVKGKPFAENWSRERLQLGEDFVSGGASSTTGRKRSRLRGGCGEVEIMGKVAIGWWRSVERRLERRMEAAQRSA